MNYKFSNISVANNNFELKPSEKIHPCLLKNHKNDKMKAIDFLSSDGKFIYIHGFLGTGKRQFVNYLCEYLNDDVIKLEYYCKDSTVCDDIFLEFTEYIEKLSVSGSLKLNAKISTLSAKFEKAIEAIKRPVLIILHALDNTTEENIHVVADNFSKVLRNQNVKIIITTCALKTNLMGNIEEDCKIYLKGFTKGIFKEFVTSFKIKASDKQIEDFYTVTRGYYFYTLLSIKIIQTLNISLVEFLQKAKNSGVLFDKYLGEIYISLIPDTIRNFFWFLRAVRHGLSLNALAILELYDEFSIQYLKSNFIVFQLDENLYLYDYFSQRIDITLPDNIEIKLHKYIINIYEKQLKENISNRVILISRQALRQEIDYHSNRIRAIENGKTDSAQKDTEKTVPNQNKTESQTDETLNDTSISSMYDEAKKLAEEDKYKDAIDKFKLIIDSNELNSSMLVDIRLNLARLYNLTEDYSSSLHYYELAEAYYKNNNELINLNYLYYEMTKLFYKMYKLNRAIDTIKKVIYSVDTPQSLMVTSCTLLGNIYSDMNNPEEAFSYYQKALDSLDENVDNSVLAELYFKFALSNDDKGDLNLAFEYYNRCISITGENKYLALAYSNLASCYYENGNSEDALSCFNKAYELEKAHNNYDGIYYTSSHIARILCENGNPKAYQYLSDAKQSAEFLNEAFYIVESSVALGDYYYNVSGKEKEALNEYCKAQQIATNSPEDIDTANITKRIEDMKLRMSKKSFEEILKKYD